MPQSELDELEVGAADSFVDDPATEDTEDPDGEPSTPDPKELQRENRALADRLAEAERKSTYWHEQATKKSAQPEPREEVKPKKEAKPKDFGKLFTDGDTEALDEYLAERGYVRKEDAEQMIESKATQLTTLEQYRQDYPELMDQKSELFQTVQRHAVELRADPDLRNVKPEKIAALAIKSALAEYGGKPAKGQDKEADRIARIRNQQGHTDNRRAEKSPTVLTAEEKAMARQFGISDKDYLKQKNNMQFFNVGRQ
jgi:hypothetical protein